MTRRIVITGARAPVALHLARLFHAVGHRVILADTFRHPMAAATRCKEAYVQLPPPRGHVAAYAEALRHLVERMAPDLVIPTCEEVFFLAAARDLHGVALPLFAPPFHRLRAVHDKACFAERAKGFGADPPHTIRLTRPGDVAALGERAQAMVFKPVWSRFGSRVLVRPAPHTLAVLHPSEADPWIAQTYLPGPEICAYAVANAGAMTAFQAYQPLYRAGLSFRKDALGAGVAFAPMVDAVAERFARAFVASLGWTGQIAFDFRRDADGILHVIECNPRATSGAHFFGARDRLPQAILDGVPATARDLRPMTLPLAMLTYGLRQAWSTGALRQWRRDRGAMADISAWPGDRSMLIPQCRALAEIAGRALRARSSLIEASARDIEWNGEDLGPQQADPFKAPSP